MYTLTNDSVSFPVHTELAPFLTIQKLSKDIRIHCGNDKAPWSFPIYYGIDYVISGKGVYEDTEKASYEYETGCIILLVPGRGISCEPQNCQALEHRWIRFSGILADIMFKAYADISPVIINPPSRVSQILLNIMDTCERFCNSTEVMLINTAKLLGLIGELCTISSKFGEYEPCVLNFIRYSHQHLRNWKLDLKKFLSIEGIGFESFRKKMKKATGFYPYDFWLKCKIDHAMSLLETTRMTIGEIAEHTGFNNIYYFSTFFKKKTGLAPTHYRHKHAIFSNLEVVC